MFDVSWSEMAIIMLVALVVIGPKDLPRLARTLGQWAAKGRSMAREFQRSLEDMAREAELDDVKREIEKAGRINLSKTIEDTIDPTGEIGKAFDPTAASKARRAKAAGVKPSATPAAPATGSVANGGAGPEPAPVAPASKPPAPESKPPESTPPKSKTGSKTGSKTKSKAPKAKPEAVPAEPR